jgi:hypothetical protein
MNQVSPGLPSQAVPSARALGRASAVALLAAAVILVVAVLPAEYGIDPLGTGKALGLSGLAAPMPEAAAVLPAGGALAPVRSGPFALYPGQYKVDSRQFVLGPYEYVEYKYHLEKDASMVFSWTAGADVIHDFHGDPDGAPASAAQSYEKTTRRAADGSFVAPFSGIHGWYWENPGGETITITVTTAGFYTSAREFHFNGTQQAREVRSLDAIPASN